MTLDNLEFLEEEIVLKEERIENNSDESVFHSSNTPQEKDIIGRFKVIKKGARQVKYNEGDYCLVNKNGLPKELTIEGIPPFKDTYVLPTSLRIFCKING